MRTYLKSIHFSRATLVPDLMAGLTVALVSIPEGMAYAMVAGVNPVYGLYTGMVTTIVAALTESSCTPSSAPAASRSSSGSTPPTASGKSSPPLPSSPPAAPPSSP